MADAGVPSMAARSTMPCRNLGNVASDASSTPSARRPFHERDDPSRILPPEPLPRPVPTRLDSGEPRPAVPAAESRNPPVPPRAQARQEKVLNIVWFRIATRSSPEWDYCIWSSGRKASFRASAFLISLRRRRVRTQKTRTLVLAHELDERRCVRLQSVKPFEPSKTVSTPVALNS
jgi:hypothetical protein